MNLVKAVFSKYSKLYDVNVKLDPVTIIIGQNDSGKSTLLEGIFYAASTNIILSRVKNFSKIHDDDAIVKIFFEINETDLNNIFSNLGLKSTSKDKLLIHNQYELECIYPRHGEQTLKQVKVHSDFRIRFNDDERLNMILDGLVRLLGESHTYQTQSRDRLRNSPTKKICC